MKRRVAIAALALTAGCAAPAPQSNWEREQDRPRGVDETAAPPAYPAPGRLIEFAVTDAGGFRFYIDGDTLGVGADGVVRYVLVARSPAGVDNVSYEGMHCDQAELRVYAVGGSDRQWSGRPTPWRPVSSRWHRALQREYFCPQREPLRDAAEGIRALEQGGHPFAKGFGAEGGRGR